MVVIHVRVPLLSSRYLEVVCYFRTDHGLDGHGRFVTDGTGR